MLWLSPTTQWLLSHHQTLPIVQPTPQQPSPWLASLHSLWEDIECKILCAALYLPQTQPSPITLPPSMWLTPTTLVTLHNMNAGDVWCISWILWNITDPEALDAAIWLAGTVHWFEDGLNVEPPYDQIVSMLKGCFDSAGRVYPGSRDRAYHSAQAALWIYIRALCLSREFAKRFPFPTVTCDMASLDPDLRCLLQLCNTPYLPYLVCTCMSLFQRLLMDTFSGPQMHFYFCPGPCRANQVHLMYYPGTPGACPHGAFH